MIKIWGSCGLKTLHQQNSILLDVNLTCFLLLCVTCTLLFVACTVLFTALQYLMTLHDTWNTSVCSACLLNKGTTSMAQHVQACMSSFKHQCNKGWCFIILGIFQFAWPVCWPSTPKHLQAYMSTSKHQCNKRQLTFSSSWYQLHGFESITVVDNGKGVSKYCARGLVLTMLLQNTSRQCYNCTDNRALRVMWWWERG